MDQGLKTSKYKPYTMGAVPEAGAYNNPGDNWQGAAVTGIPMYPDATPENQRLSRFVVQGYKDLWAAVLFMGVVIMSFVWGSVNLITYNFFLPTNSSNNFFFTIYKDKEQSFVLPLSVSGVASIGGSFVLLMLLGKFPRQLIYVANILTAILNLLASVLFFLYGSKIFGGVFLFLGIFQAIWFFCVRSRIPFSAELLKASADILMRYKTLFLFTFLLAIMSIGYFFFWIAMAIPTFRNIADKSDTVKNGVLLTFFVLVLFWVMQVVPNIMHVTTAGVAATWYFAGEGRMPKNPSLASFKRATTTSFGSICFGSFIVAMLNLLRWLVDTALEGESEYIRCIALCILGCIEALAERFNSYAFVHVAVYGCGYIEGAKRTWKLCKQCFFAAVFNDALVGTTIRFVSLTLSVFIATILGLIYNSIAIGIVSFCMAFVVHSIFLSSVESVVTTIFVCFAEVPEGLQYSSPDLYVALHRTDQNRTHNNAIIP